MTVTELLQSTPSIQFVVDTKGNKTAVQLDFATWQFILNLLDWLETELQVPRLTQEMSRLLADQNITLEELLDGLAQEKQKLYEETYGANTTPTFS
jgi:hypothetical protein